MATTDDPQIPAPLTTYSETLVPRVVLLEIVAAAAAHMRNSQGDPLLFQAASECLDEALEALDRREDLAIEQAKLARAFPHLDPNTDGFID